MKWLRSGLPFRLPDSLRSRIILFVVIGVLFSQVLVLMIWTVQARSQARAEVAQTASELAAAGVQAVRFFKALPVQFRPMLIDQLRTTGGSRFVLQLNRARVEEAAQGGEGLARLLATQVEQAMASELAAHGLAGVRVTVGPAAALVVTDSGLHLGELPKNWIESAGLTADERRPLLTVQAELDPGNWLLLATALPNPALFEKANPYAPDRLLLVLAGLVALLAVVVVVAREITRSLSQLGQSASAFARDMVVAPIPETGPQEVRGLARAFNDMQALIGRAVSDREQLFRGVSHDLQTPIMRLKFRAEMVEDAEIRQGLRDDLQELSDLLKGALTTMRGAELNEATSAIALDELLASLIAPGVAAGVALTLSAQPTAVWGKPLAIKRALGNLIDNAVRYGIRVDIRLQRAGECAEIVIRDHGPGLPPEALQRMFEPYQRLDHGRQHNAQGNGLGLWMARNTVRRHGGDIVLRNHPEGGLEAVVTLKGLVDRAAD